MNKISFDLGDLMGEFSVLRQEWIDRVRLEDGAKKAEPPRTRVVNFGGGNRYLDLPTEDLLLLGYVSCNEATGNLFIDSLRSLWNNNPVCRFFDWLQEVTTEQDTIWPTDEEMAVSCLAEVPL